MSTSRRIRNPRGEGERLRREILDAAAEILEETGDEGALTLRAVARKVGITAPSIYGHFEDREAILDALLTLTFDSLQERLRTAVEAGREDPVEALRAGCAAYIAFAAEQPQRYRILFQLRGVTESPGDSIEEMVGAESFVLLVESIEACVEAGSSTSPSPFESALQLWIAMHGFATLRASTPGFPWPDPDGLLDSLIDRLAFIGEWK